MDEREHHNEFYAETASHIFDTPAFREARSRYFGFLQSHSGNLSQKSILSLGSGLGDYEIMASPLCREIIGVELSGVAVEKARSLAQTLNLKNVEFLVGDIVREDVVGTERRFEVIWAVAVLHHLKEEEIRALLIKYRPFLKDGGLFICADPNSRRLVRFLKFLVRRKCQEYHTEQEAELNYRLVQSFFLESGYHNPSVYFVDFFLSPLAWSIPSLPIWVVKFASAIDRFLLKLPWIKTFASSFGIVAHA